MPLVISKTINISKQLLSVSARGKLVPADDDPIAALGQKMWRKRFGPGTALLAVKSMCTRL
jgi:hypothetical protein